MSDYYYTENGYEFDERISMAKYFRREQTFPLTEEGWSQGESVPIKEEEPWEYMNTNKLPEPKEKTIEEKLAEMNETKRQNEAVRKMVDEHMKIVKSIVGIKDEQES